MPVARPAEAPGRSRIIAGVRSRTFVAVVVLLCLACGGGEKPVAGKPAAPPLDTATPQDGGTLVRRLSLDISTLNPITLSTRYDRYVANYLFTPVVHLDRNLQPIPGLADSWEISDDGLTYRFFLNKNATFTDGTPVRASDVVFTLRKIADPDAKAVQSHDAFVTLDVDKTRAIDDHTVEVKFRQRLAAQLLRFNDVLVVPERVYGGAADPNPDADQDFLTRAVGSGPYELVRRDIGKEIVMQRRKAYWGDRPHIATVIFKVVNDHGIAFNALKRGELDETLVPADTWTREHNNPQTARTINFQRFYSLNYNYIAWNNRNPLLKDKRVRRAMSMCIPIDAVIQNLYQGTARAMSGPFTPDDWAYNPTVPVVRYDPQGARELFAQVGWRDTNADGVLDRGGKPFKFDLIIMTGAATSQQVGQLVQSELKKIGVQVNVVMMDGATAIQRLFAGQYDAAYLSWDMDPDPDPYAIFHSSQMPDRGQNFVFYASAEADRIMDQARSELDPEKRKDLYWRLHEILAEDQPYTWVVQVSAKWGLSRRVQNVVSSRGLGFFQWYPGELGWWIAQPAAGDSRVAGKRGAAHTGS
jgi:peptide/nickel transport system substrate-binding protein